MMLALEMYRSCRVHRGSDHGRRMPGILTGPAAPLRLVNREEPRLPDARAGRGWRPGSPASRVRSGRDHRERQPVLHRAGLDAVRPGHEVVGVLLDDCGDLPKGTRVVLDSVLGCAARGVDLCPGCAAGQHNRCDHVTVGQLRPGLQTGFCADTGGGWGAELVAHRSQLHAVPDGLTDERRSWPNRWPGRVHVACAGRGRTGDQVLVSGAGAVGLFVTLALRRAAPPPAGSR